MKRKLLMATLAIMLLLQMPLQQSYSSGGTDSEEAAAAVKPQLNAKNAVAIEYETNQRIFEKNADTPVPMASTTKIMTALIVLEECSINETVTISSLAAATGGSTMNLKVGEKLTVEELLYGLMLNSGNDAAMALAEHVGGSVQDFCNIMNRKAQALGLKQTNFTSPHGLDESGHFTTAAELAAVMREALKHKKFCELIATRSITAGGHSLRNTNPFLGTETVEGGKTGFTNNAGRCIVLVAHRNGIRVIIVLLGCDSSALRVSDGTKLLNYSLEYFRNYTLLERGSLITTLSLYKSKKNIINAIAAETVRLTMSEDDYKKTEITFQITNPKYDKELQLLKSSVEKGEILGTLEVKCDGKILYSGNIVSSEDAQRKSVTDYFSEILGKWSHIIDIG